MVPHKEGHHLLVFKQLYPQKHKHGHSIIENSFGILKKTFKKIFGKIK